MRRLLWASLLTLLFSFSAVSAEGSCGAFSWDSSDYFRDIQIAREIQRSLCYRYPVTYTFASNGGYFVCPSARTGENGTITAGWASQPPYYITNIAVQLTSRLEVSLNYRVFRGIDDDRLSQYGFGDFSDKGANAKVVLIHPEDSDYRLPGIAVGFEDFLGTRSFKGSYVVFTQVFLDHNLEGSIGFGVDRLRGLFGALSWNPFRCSESTFLQGIHFTAEYDPVDYENPAIEQHPDGRVKSSPINFGAKWRLYDAIELSFARIRGEEFAGSAAISYNLGAADCLVPKIYDPPPYKAPCDTEPIGLTRDEEAVIHDFCMAFRGQQLCLLEVWFSQDECNRRILRLCVANGQYRLFCDQRERITRIVTYLTPSNVDEVIVVVKDVGLPIHEYHFREEDLCRRRNCEIGDYELAILSPLYDASLPDCHCDTLAYRVSNWSWLPYIYPSFNTMWGSARGKFKYSLGFDIGVTGLLAKNVFFVLNCNYCVYSTMRDVGSMDILNPSQQVNVRTDAIVYKNESDFQVSQAFLQNHWNLGCGFFGRVAGGYFEQAYGGFAAELMWYPVWSDFAVSLQGAYLWKRKYSGLGFTDQFRKFTDRTPGYVTFTPYQYFLNFYYDWNRAHLDFKLTVGQFLLHDFGARLQVGRYFRSGMRLFGWYARTSAEDYINHERYYDKGVGITIYPEIFFGFSSRREIGFAMNAWNRDIAGEAGSGIHLYDLVHGLRED